MPETIAKLGVSGGIGFLIGLVAVWWVEPTTEGGVVLLVAIFVIASTVIGGIVSHFFGQKGTVLAKNYGRRQSAGRMNDAEIWPVPPPGRPYQEEATASSQSSGTKVFISYSHADKKWLERLKRHLRPLVRDGYLNCWDDTHIQPGDDWQQEIRTALDTARAAVLLISADFFASDFIDESELPPLLTAAQEKGVRVLPLILSASRFARDPSLSRFQAVNSPDRPLNEISEGEQEEVLERLAQKVESALNHP